MKFNWYDKMYKTVLSSWLGCNKLQQNGIMIIKVLFLLSMLYVTEIEQTLRSTVTLMFLTNRQHDGQLLNCFHCQGGDGVFLQRSWYGFGLLISWFSVRTPQDLIFITINQLFEMFIFLKICIVSLYFQVETCFQVYFKAVQYPEMTQIRGSPKILDVSSFLQTKVLQK